MSTCPKCKGHLTESHRCPRGPLIVAVEILLAALAGGFVGLLLAAIVDPHGQIDTIFLVGGASIGVALGRAFLR